MAKYSNGMQDDLDLTPAAITVLEGRYLKRDETGKPIETANDMFKRVAINIAQADKNYGETPEQSSEIFYENMKRGLFMPNSPTLMNAGRDLQQLSACFVLPVGDSIDSIFESAKWGALVHKSGGGTGYDFSQIRPKNSIVKSTSGVASGPVSFMYVFNSYTDVVKQGSTRRGANMGMLRIDHPDILEFIDAKSVANEKTISITKRYSDSNYISKDLERTLIENYQLNNFNISVALTDRFMEAVEKGQEYDLINPVTKKIVGKLDARKVFQKISENAWRYGEPGIVFIDKINKFNPTPGVGLISATNPCGEQPLLPFESCNLGSIDVSKFVKGGKIDYEGLQRTVHDAVHFLDNVIDMNSYPLPQIEKMTKGNRKIGLGIMGFADLLFELGIPYGSHESYVKAEKIMSFVQEESKKASAELAKKRGSFPNIELSIYKGQNMRNATTTTIAPTGTIGVITGCSQGIEPLYALTYTRTTPQFKLIEGNKVFEKIIREKGLYSKELMEKIADNNGSLKGLDLPEELKDIFITANEISPENHIRMQAVLQKYVDNAVSKTINMPQSASVEDVANAYRLAFKTGCKGLTVYRDKSREIQVLSSGKTPSGKRKTLQTIIAEEALSRKRPENVGGKTIKKKTPLGTAYIVINQDESTGEFYETFCQVGKSGTEVTTMAEAISRLESMILKLGVPPTMIIEQLEGIGGANTTWDEGGKGTIKSVPDGIAKALKERLAQIEEEKGEKKYLQTQNKKEISGNICMKCGAPLMMIEGCEKCSNIECDYSKCG